MFSQLWHFAGMNVINGKVVAIRDGQGTPFTPGIAAGFVVRTGDKFVTGALDQSLTGSLKSYTNEDVYVVVTRSWLHPPIPFLANLGWKATQRIHLRHRRPGYAVWRTSLRRPGHSHPGAVQDCDCAGGRIYAGATDFEEPRRAHVPAGRRAHLPTTLDYAVRVTQKENPHFAFDIGVGQIAGNVGTTAVVTPSGRCSFL